MLAHIIDGWEIPLILSVVLILFGAGKALDLMRGETLGRDAHDPGRSIGGIFCKRATEAKGRMGEQRTVYAAPLRLLSASLITNRALSRATSVASPAVFTESRTASKSL
jgi:hypothetical protein